MTLGLADQFELEDESRRKLVAIAETDWGAGGRRAQWRPRASMLCPRSLPSKRHSGTLTSRRTTRGVGRASAKSTARTRWQQRSVLALSWRITWPLESHSATPRSATNGEGRGANVNAFGCEGAQICLSEVSTPTRLCLTQGWTVS